MGAPKVSLGVLDLTTRVPQFPGVAVGIVVPCLKGPTDKAFLCTDEADFLNFATPDSTVAVGMDLAHYDALAALGGTNKLWVARTQNKALSGGIVVASNAPAWAATNAYVVGDRVLPGTPNGFVYECAVAGTSHSTTPVFPTVIGSTVTDGGVTWKCVSRRVGTFAIPIGYLDIADYDFGASATTWAPSSTYLTGAKVQPRTPNGFYYNATTGGVGHSTEPVWPLSIGATIVEAGVTWTCEGTIADDALLISQSNQGAWGLNVSIKLFNFASSPTTVKVADAFYVQIFSSGVQVEGGSGNNGFLCSRVPGKKDGFGTNIFVEDRLKSSNYISAKSNSVVASRVQPVQISIALKMKGGSDGQAVTDTQMIAAADLLANPAKFPLTLLIDGGWATPAFGVKLDAVATDRGDCEAFLSTPISVEEDASPVTAITEYRNVTLNLNSSRSWLYTNHVQITDKYNQRTLMVPPTGFMAAIVSKTAASFDLWLPPAGFDERTKLPVTDVVNKFTDGDLDILSDNQVNAIVFSPGEGIHPNDQQTLLNVPSALQEGNVALLLLVIEPALKAAMKNFLFKFNTPASWAVAKARIESFLQGIKNAPIPGLSDFRVQIDSGNNDTEADPLKMNVWVFLTPTRAIREIPITIVLTNPGATLSLGTGG